MSEDFAHAGENLESHMLIVFGGLPGTGKTTVAKALAEKLHAVLLRVDTIEQAIRSSAVVETDIGPAGYIVAYRLAEDNLRIGSVVVADSVNPLQVTRDAWLSVAKHTSSKVAEVEVICSDAVEHRRRVETRRSDIEQLKLPEWQDIIDREYENWNRSHIVIDTASKTVTDTVAELLARLECERH